MDGLTFRLQNPKGKIPEEYKQGTETGEKAETTAEVHLTGNPDVPGSCPNRTVRNLQSQE